MCRTRLERFGEGAIYPHEETHASAKADRLRLTRACRANLSQIFGLYPDADRRSPDSCWRQQIAEQTPVEAHRSPGRRAPSVARHRSAGHQPPHRLDGRQADLHRRWSPPLRNGLQLSRRTGPATAARGQPPGQLRPDDVRGDE